MKTGIEQTSIRKIDIKKINIKKTNIKGINIKKTNIKGINIKNTNIEKINRKKTALESLTAPQGKTGEYFLRLSCFGVAVSYIKYTLKLKQNKMIYVRY